MKVRAPVPSGVTPTIPIRYPLLLAVCTLLFTLRVLGQVVVAVGDVHVLPPFAQWYSGLLPYSLLLPVQIALIALMLRVVLDFARGRGTFVALQPRTGRILQWVAGVYFLVMVVRYILTMTLHPELRWFTGTIPIWFHMVLAAFILVLGRYQVRRDSMADARTAG